MIDKLTGTENDTVYTESDFIVDDHDINITTTLNFKVTDSEGNSKSVTYGNFHSGITDLAISVLKENLNELSRGEVSSAFKIEKRGIFPTNSSTAKVARVKRRV